MSGGRSTPMLLRVRGKPGCPATPRVRAARRQRHSHRARVWSKAPAAARPARSVGARPAARSRPVWRDPTRDAAPRALPQTPRTATPRRLRRRRAGCPLRTPRAESRRSFELPGRRAGFARRASGTKSAAPRPASRTRHTGRTEAVRPATSTRSDTGTRGRRGPARRSPTRPRTARSRRRLGRAGHGRRGATLPRRPSRCATTPIRRAPLSSSQSTAEPNVSSGTSQIPDGWPSPPNQRRATASAPWRARRRARSTSTRPLEPLRTSTPTPLSRTTPTAVPCKPPRRGSSRVGSGLAFMHRRRPGEAPCARYIIGRPRSESAAAAASGGPTGSGRRRARP